MFVLLVMIGNDRFQVYVQVLDVNDHLPLTLLPTYHFLVEENLPSHSAVGQISASDADLGAEHLKFTLFPHFDGLTLPFSIDSKTGWLLYCIQVDCSNFATIVIS